MSDEMKDQLRHLKAHVAGAYDPAAPQGATQSGRDFSQGFVSGFACATLLPIEELVRIAHDEPTSTLPPPPPPNDNGAFLLGTSGRSTLRLLAHGLNLTEPVALDLAIRDTYRRLLEHTTGAVAATEHVSTFGRVDGADLERPAGVFPCGCSIEMAEAGLCGAYDQNQLEREIKYPLCKGNR